NGVGHWRVISARLALDDVKRLASFSPQQRQRLQVAIGKNSDAQQLSREMKYTEATAAAQESIAIRKTILGPLQRDYGTSLSPLGSIYMAMGEYPKAEPLLREALEVKRGAYG